MINAMTSVVDQLMQSPRARQYADEVQRRLRAEQDRRARFYDEMTESEKVEFINGEVVVQSPVRLDHARFSDNYFLVLDTYVMKNRLGLVGHEKLLVTLTRNDYEPDVVFWSTGKASTFEPGQMQFPAPDLVVEVLSKSTESIDRGVKFQDYADHGVTEYLLIDPTRQAVEQYVLQDGVYQLRLNANTGTLSSVALPGFDIPVTAIFDDAQNITALRTILVQL